MKKILFITVLSFCSGILFAQKTLSVRDESNQKAVAERAKEGEAIVVVRSPYDLSFESVTKEKEKDKKVTPYHVEKDGQLNVYHLLFSALPKYKDRKLLINSEGYKTLTQAIPLTSYEVKTFYVWDEKGKGAGVLKDLINEGNLLFNQCKYDQARVKFLDASESFQISPGSQEEENAIILGLDKVDQCIEAKEKAEKLFNKQEWLAAIAEYEKVLAMNPADSQSKERCKTCKERFDNSPRVITGTVTDINGNPLPGVNIVALESKDKRKNPRVATDASGAYQIKTTHKTTQLIYWKDMLDSEKTIQITGDIINITVR